MELLMKHRTEFKLLNEWSENDAVLDKFNLLGECEDEMLLNKQESKQLTIKNMKNLLKLNITQKNVYDLLYIADYYKYDKIEEVIEKIRELIFNSGWIFNRFKINKIKLNNERLYNQIYNCEECNESNLEHANFKHLTCFKKNIKIYENELYEGNYCSCRRYGEWCYPTLAVLIGKHNNLDVIKYVMENYKCKFNNPIDDVYTIRYSCIFGHANIIEYLIENILDYDKYAIMYCLKYKQIECLKVLNKYMNKYHMDIFPPHLYYLIHEQDRYKEFLVDCHEKKIITDDFYDIIMRSNTCLQSIF